jgi:hypothetical protein
VVQRLVSKITKRTNDMPSQTIQPSDAPVNEVWKPCPGHPGYEVSNLGRVRSYRIKKPGCVLSPTSHMLATCYNLKGYAHVILRNAFCKPSTKTVHRLVLEAFIGPRPIGMEACHWNGNRRDCRLDNLRWDYPSSNAQDKKRHGTYLKGETVHNHKLTIDSVAFIRNSQATGRHLAEQFNVRESTISAVRKKRLWAWT